MPGQRRTAARSLAPSPLAVWPRYFPLLQGRALVGEFFSGLPGHPVFQVGRLHLAFLPGRLPL